MFAQSLTDVSAAFKAAADVYPQFTPTVQVLSSHARVGAASLVVSESLTGKAVGVNVEHSEVSDSSQRAIDRFTTDVFAEAVEEALKECGVGVSSVSSHEHVQQAIDLAIHPLARAVDAAIVEAVRQAFLAERIRTS